MLHVLLNAMSKLKLTKPTPWSAVAFLPRGNRAGPGLTASRPIERLKIRVFIRLRAG